ncbi:hypothetical protein Tco_1432221 [Tanacetum coccineum]
MLSKNEFGDLDMFKLTEQEDDDVIIEEYDDDEDSYKMMGGAEGHDGIVYFHHNNDGSGRRRCNLVFSATSFQLLSNILLPTIQLSWLCSFWQNGFDVPLPVVVCSGIDNSSSKNMVS